MCGVFGGVRVSCFVLYGAVAPFGLDGFTSIHAGVDFKLLASLAFDAAVLCWLCFEASPIDRQWGAENVAATSCF